MTTGRRILLLGGIALCAGLASRGILAQSQKPEAAKADEGAWYTVTADRRLETAVERGVVEAVSNPVVVCPADVSTTIAMLVPQGAKVVKGQLVCELDAGPLRDKLAAQEIATKRAEAAYKHARIQSEVAEITLREFREGQVKVEEQKAAGEVALARAERDRAAAGLEQTERLYQRIQDALKAQGDKQTASDIMAGMQAEAQLYAAKSRLEQNKYGVELAQTKETLFKRFVREKTEKELMSEAGKKRSEELAKEQTWELERAKGRRLGVLITRCKLHAPGDGIAVYAHDPGSPAGPALLAEGATVREGQAIMSVADLSQMQVSLKVPQRLLDRVKVGTPARVRVALHDCEVLEGAITEVVTEAEARNGPDRQHTATVKLAKVPPGLRLGMRAQAEFAVAPDDRVLCVPFPAVLPYGAKDYVAVRKPDGDVEWRPVTLGFSNDSLVEVRQGLERDDVVAVRPIAVMSDDDKREYFAAQRGFLR
jgi:RND family efflux transporter MFP subunit